MVSSLTPICLTLVSVCIKKTFVCFYVKCPFCCPMLNKIWACEEILDKLSMLPLGMKQHSQPSMNCELVYWCFCWNLSYYFRYQTGQIWRPTKDIRAFLSHIQSWYLITRKIIRTKVAREEWITLISRMCLATFPFLGNYTE